VVWHTRGSLAFYCDVLGMKLLATRFPGQVHLLAFVGYGGEDSNTVLELHVTTTAWTRRATILVNATCHIALGRPGHLQDGHGSPRKVARSRRPRAGSDDVTVDRYIVCVHRIDPTATRWSLINQCMRPMRRDSPMARLPQIVRAYEVPPRRASLGPARLA